jgi:AcrR family transcriptional regulator
MPTSIATRRRLAPAERRAQLLDAASTAFLAGGFDGTSMDDVARQAGVTRLIVYRHFESKTTIYRAVLDSVVSRLRTEFAGHGSVDVAARGGIVRALLTVARGRPDAFRLLWRHAAHEPEFAGYAADFRSIADAYTEAALEPRDVDPGLRRWTARALSAHVIEGVCSWLDVGDPDDDDLFAARHAAGARALLTALTA